MSKTVFVVLSLAALAAGCGKSKSEPKAAPKPTEPKAAEPKAAEPKTTDVALPADCPGKDELGKMVAAAIDAPADAKYEIQTCGPHKLPDPSYFVTLSSTDKDKKEWIFLALDLQGKRLAQAAVPLGGDTFDGININSDQESDHVAVFIGNSVSGEGDVWHLTRKGATFEMTKTTEKPE